MLTSLNLNKTMILEVAILDVIPNKITEFETSFKKAQSIIIPVPIFNPIFNQISFEDKI